MTFIFIPLGQHFKIGVNLKKTKKAPSSVLKASGNGETGTTMSSEMKTKRKQEEHAREGKLLRFAEQGQYLPQALQAYSKEMNALIDL